MTAPAESPQVEQLVQQCQDLVRSLAASVHRRLPSHVDLDDLIAYGQVGLVEAARDFDPARGGKFSTYAYYRVRGAVYDGLSKMTWFSRAQYHRMRYERMANEVMRSDGEEGAPSPEASQDEQMRWFRDITRTLAVVYLSTRRGADDEDESTEIEDRASTSGPTEVINREIHQKLNELIDALPAEERELIRATYFEGATLQEAGRRLGVSKSWASRLHAKTLRRLACALKLQGVAS